MNIIGIIPARMASTRFPGKPLSPVSGMPMIGHVYLRSKMSSIINHLFVATCDIEIKNYIESIGGVPIMTSKSHERASDRTAEALLKIESRLNLKSDIVVMIQGDEPMIHPQMIDLAIKPMIEDKNVLVTNLMAELKTIEEAEDPNEVKVVVDCFDNAVYFSREPIPSRKKANQNVKYYKQVCIIPFKRNFLMEYNQMKQTPLEIIESVDMLRVIENGYKVKMVYSDFETYSVDTQHDIEVVRKKMSEDTLIERYLK